MRYENIKHKIWKPLSRNMPFFISACFAASFSVNNQYNDNQHTFWEVNLLKGECVKVNAWVIKRRMCGCVKVNAWVIKRPSEEKTHGIIIKFYLIYKITSFFILALHQILINHKWNVKHIIWCQLLIIHLVFRQWEIISFHSKMN